MNKKEAINLSIRYLVLLVLGIFIEVFYIIFKPITIYPVYYILKLFYPNSHLLFNTVIIGNLHIDLISACVAGAAYYLLLIFNLSTPVKPKPRILAIIFTFIVFLVINIIRIIVISVLAITRSSYFRITHELFWYLGSTLFVILIWFASVYLFKIKAIPGYTDAKNLFKTIKQGRKRKK